MEHKILIVDDEEIVRSSCRKILGSAGKGIFEADKGSDALKVIDEHTFDVVLSDLKLPDLSGIDLLKTVKEITPDTEVILITGYGTVSTAVEAMKLGAYDYVEKPFRPDELLSIVERAIERKSLREENRRLKDELSTRYIKNIVGTSGVMERVFRMIASVAPTISTVLITGDSGTGKELIARGIHYNSPRKDMPFVIVDCGSIPGDLLESELFGYRKGAFTGAYNDKAGLLEAAAGGTLFLDEVGNMSLQLQAKLLRVLQEKEFRPLGDSASRRVDVRFVAATNRDLQSMVRDGSFREDLYYRLNIFPIHLPSLRERREDIPLLVYHFLEKYNEELETAVENISVEAMRVLTTYDWPGNVRELESTIQRAILMSNGRRINPEDLNLLFEKNGGGVPRDADELRIMKKSLRERSVAEVERVFVIEALRDNDWNVTRAARAVGMQRPNFHALMKKHRISKAG